MKWVINVLLAFLIQSQTALGQQWNDTTKALLSASASDASGAAWRNEFAIIIHVYCTELSRKTPRNSPREQDWVLQELKSADLGRFARVMESVEFSRYSLVEIFENCMAHSIEIVRRPSWPREALLWAKLARNFNDVDGVKKNAARLGLYGDDTTNDPYALAFWGGFRLKMMERGVIEMLEGQ